MISNIEGEKIKSIFEIASLITSEKEFFEIKEMLMEEMSSVVGSVRASISLFCVEDKRYTYLVSSKNMKDMTDDLLKDSYKTEIGNYKIGFDKYPYYVHEAVNERKYVWIKNVFEDERAENEREMATKYAYTGRIVFPIIIKNKTLGFFTCLIDGEDDISEDDIGYIFAVSVLIGLSAEISRKRYYRESIVQKLKKSIGYINDATKALYKNRGIDNFLSMISSYLCTITNSQSAVIILKDDKNDTRRFNQHGNDINLIKVFEKIKSAYPLEMDRGNYFNYEKCKDFGLAIKSFIYYELKRKEETIGYIMAVDGDGYDDDDLNIFNIFSNQVVIAMEMYLQSKKRVEHKLFQKELELVSKQQSLIMGTDKIEIEDKGEISFYHRPSKYIGGDFCRIEKVGDGRYAVFLADVMGHGIMSNYFAAMIKGSIKTLLLQDKSPAEILTYLNKVLYSDFDKASVFATARVAVFDFEKNIMTSANGGHHYPIGIKRIKEDYVIEELDVEEGFPVGILHHNEYEQHNYDLSEFELMAFYTDGIIEAQNERGENYGEERLKEFLLKNHGLKSDILYSRFREEIKEFTGQESLEDDYILLVFKKQQSQELGEIEDVLLDYKCKS